MPAKGEVEGSLAVGSLVSCIALDEEISRDLRGAEKGRRFWGRIWKVEVRLSLPTMGEVEDIAESLSSGWFTYSN